MKHFFIGADGNPTLLERARSLASGIYNQIFDEHTTNNDDISEYYQLPPELQLRIMSFLHADELINASLVCKKFYKISKDNILWKRLAEDFGIPSHWPGYSHNSIKQQFKQYKMNYLYVMEKYSKKIIDLFGGGKYFTIIPTLNTTEPMLSSNISPTDLKGHEFIQNTDVNFCEIALPDFLMNIKCKIDDPYVAFCIKYHTEDNDTLPMLYVLVLRINSDGYVEMRINDEDWLPVTSEEDESRTLDYIKRLIAHAPCGDYYTNETTKILSDGRSIVELTDQSDEATVQKERKLK